MQNPSNYRTAAYQVRPNWPIISILAANTVGWAIVAAVGRVILG